MPAIQDGDFKLSEMIALVSYLGGKNHSIATSSLLQTVKNAYVQALVLLKSINNARSLF